MIGQETRETERKIAAILKVLSDSGEPLGGRLISRKLKEQGVNLGERAVRYHLKIMDERGLTKITRSRDGRTITSPGLEELNSSLVWDKVGFLSNKIEMLSYLTDYDAENDTGNIPVDVSIFPREEFPAACKIMKDVFLSDFCTSDLVAKAEQGERLGELLIPEGKIGLATVSSIIVNGLLLKAGIPLDSMFGGVLQIRSYEPTRFVNLIEYSGSTLDPYEMFISSTLTNIIDIMKTGTGQVLASYHEMPILSRFQVESLITKLQNNQLYRAYVIGNPNENICEVPARLNRVGMILFSGLNPIAAASESGITVTCKAMSGLMDRNLLKSFNNL
jgi:repressor of nif and glnA expression